MACIVVQTNPNWTLHVVCNGPVEDIEFIKSVFINVPNIRYSTLDKHYDNFGHACRNYGVLHATEEWVAMSSNDNYYMPCFVDEILKAIQTHPNAKMIYTDMIHNHYGYDLFKCQPLLGWIDIGNMVTRANLTKQLPLDINQYAADGIFAENYVKTFCQPEDIVYLPHVYYAHN